MVRALYFNSALRNILWPELVRTAVYLRNRMPQRPLNMRTAFELLHKQKPSLGHLRVIGCLGYVSTPSNSIGKGPKLAPRAKRCVLVGYDAKNYRVWLLDEKRLQTVRDVQFNENEFPDVDICPQVRANHPAPMLEQNDKRPAEPHQDAPMTKLSRGNDD